MEYNELPARIAEEIATLISVGDLPANGHLNTQRLAARFAVSRTPVREALELLARRGVVELRPNKGYFTQQAPAVTRTPQERAATPTDAPPVYFRLAEDWLRDLVPDEVTEQFLRERYKLTKGQVAAVLDRAASEGWMERKAGYGWRFIAVAKTPEAAEQIYRLRLALEPAGVLEPTFQLNRPAIEGLKSTFHAMLAGAIETWPVDRLQAAGVQFHEELMKMSGNPFFYQALVRANRVRRLLDYRAMVDRRRVYQETKEHLQIIELLLKGEIAEASYMLRQHVGRATRRKLTSSERGTVQVSD